MSIATKNKAKVGFVSLGCPKALVDSERILGQLRHDGYEISPTYDGADVVVVNTCGFIDQARAESLDAIDEALSENGKVIVTGCMGVHEQEVRGRFPDILAVSGPQQYEQVVSAVHQHAPIAKSHDPFTDLIPQHRVALTPRHYAYLKISEGCNHKCTFCIIPSMRGRLASRPAGDVMREAESLVRSGVKELLVISQDTSAYGVDLKYRLDFHGGRPVKTRLTELCEALSSFGVWVRLHYVYPYPHVDELIPLMAEGKVLPYLDVPFQHASRKVLKAMRRPAAAENNLARVRAWREICPELTIRSTFIVGFPGETEDDFEQLLEFLDEAQLDRVGCFQYSPVEGATANALAEPVADEVKQDRYDRFMQAQQKVSAARMQAKVGKTMRVLVDEVNGQKVVARSEADAPEIDGQVHFDAVGVQPGEFRDVAIVGADEYDLHGTLAC